MAKFETANGVIYYEVLETPAPDNSRKPTLTLLHNFMSTGRTAWGPMLDDLLLRFRILLPDLPGHGQSIGYPRGFHHTLLAEQIADLMAAEDAAGGHIAGCSSGGMIAQLLVAHGLVAPASVTLVSTTYTVDPAKLTGRRAPLSPEHFQAGENWLEATARLHDPYHYDGYYREILLPGFRNIGLAAAIDLPLTTFATWEMPVCLIHGERDEFFPPSMPEKMAAVLPNPTLHIIPRQTHALIFRRPWQVNELMDAFFAEQAGVALTG